MDALAPCLRRLARSGRRREARRPAIRQEPSCARRDRRRGIDQQHWGQARAGFPFCQSFAQLISVIGRSIRTASRQAPGVRAARASAPFRWRAFMLGLRPQLWPRAKARRKTGGPSDVLWTAPARAIRAKSRLIEVKIIRLAPRLEWQGCANLRPSCDGAANWSYPVLFCRSQSVPVCEVSANTGRSRRSGERVAGLGLCQTECAIAQIGRAANTGGVVGAVPDRQDPVAAGGVAQGRGMA